MSIPALNNTSDYDVYFKQYLKSLELQNDLNKKNFDANYAFRKTGVQETERADMRPIEERMNDVEKLKVQARMMLNKVTDANNTSEIMEYLLQNDKILFFFIQNFPALEEVVKRQFSGGILASQMISLIYKAYLKYTDEVLIPDSADFDLVKSIVTQEQIYNLIDIADDNNLIHELRRVKDDYPTQDEIDKFKKNPEQYVTEIQEFAENNKDKLTQTDILPLIEAFDDRKLYQNDPTSQASFNQRQDELGRKIYDGVPGQIQSQEKSKIPSKALSRKPTKTAFEKSQASYDAKLKKLIEKQQKEDEKLKKLIEKQQKEDEKLKKLEEERLALEETNRKAAKLKKDEQIRVQKGRKEIADKNVAIIKKQNQAKAAAEAQAAAQAQTAAAQAQPAPQAQPTQQGTGLLDNREKHIHRFKVLKGEVLAGNLSSSVIKELKSLVVKMINFNELEPPQALMILKELNKIK
jgi:hypothetical protein